MRIGVPKEIKDNEFRVGLTPNSVAELTHHGHQVMVEKSARRGIGSHRRRICRRGRNDCRHGRRRFSRRPKMIVKVKEPLAEERKRLRRGQILFTYLHLAPDLPQTRDLIASGADLHRL